MKCDNCLKEIPNNEWNGYRNADGLRIRFCNPCDKNIQENNKKNCLAEAEGRVKSVEELPIEKQKKELPEPKPGESIEKENGTSGHIEPVGKEQGTEV